MPLPPMPPIIRDGSLTPPEDASGAAVVGVPPGGTISGAISTVLPSTSDFWSCATGLPTSIMLICLTTASSQPLALPLILATASSSVPWIQSRSCADQTLLSVGGLAGSKTDGRSSVILSGTTTMPLPVSTSQGLTLA